MRGQVIVRLSITGIARILGAVVLVGLAQPALAQTAQPATDATDTAPAAAGGVVAGAVVAGPFGAVIGGIAGALNAAAQPPIDVRQYVISQPVGPASYAGDISVGATVNGAVDWQSVPNHPNLRWAYLTGQRVVVDGRQTVVAIFN